MSKSKDEKSKKSASKAVKVEVVNSHLADRIAGKVDEQGNKIKKA